jgi:hypothetical protein
MGTELEDNQEMIFICEMVLQNPPNGVISTFQRDVDSNGNVISTQTASIAATSTRAYYIVASSGVCTLTGTDVTLTVA